MPFSFSQSAEWHAREKRRGRNTHTADLHQTHSFLESDNPITTVADQFPDRDRDITVEAEVTITSAAPNGIVFELGGGTAGLTLVIFSNFAAVYAGAAGDDGVAAFSSALPNVAGAKVRLVVAVRPGTGEAWLWINDRLAAKATSVNGQLVSGWGTAQDGAVGDIEGTVHPDVPGGNAVTLVNATVNGRVRVYNGQLPHTRIN
jgi:hypothetical protein